MKRNAFNVIVSILLILVGLASLATAAFGGLECYMLYKLRQELPAADEVEKVEEAINLIKENEDKYLEGVEAVYNGDYKLLQGFQTVRYGRSELANGTKELENAQKEYDAAVIKLNEGKAQVAEAKAKMEEARPQYEEGKAQLAKLEQVQPLLEKYVEFKNGTLENYDGFNSLNAWYIAVVIPYLASQGLELPSDMDAFTESMAQQIAEGNAMLEEYENAEAQLNLAQAQIDDAEAQLADAKAVIDGGYKTIDDGYKQLDDAEDQLYYAAGKLAEGKATLGEFEEAIGKLEEGIVELMKIKPVCDRQGNVAVEGIGGRLGDDFDIYKHNEEGEILSMTNGEPQLDMDKCLAVCTAYRGYVNDYGESLKTEFIQRAIIDGLLLVASVLAIIAAITALRGREKAVRRGLIVLAMLIAVNIFGIVVGYAHFAHPDGEETYSGLLPFAGIAVLTLMTIIFTLACRGGRKKYLKAKAAADAVEAEKLAEAEAEQALLDAERLAEEKKARIAAIVAEVQQKEAEKKLAAERRAEEEAKAAEEAKLAAQKHAEEKKARIAAIVAEVHEKEETEAAKKLVEAEKKPVEAVKSDAEEIAEEKAVIAALVAETVAVEVPRELTAAAPVKKDELCTSSIEVRMTETERADYEKSKAEYEEALKKYLELRNKYKK